MYQNQENVHFANVLKAIKKLKELKNLKIPYKILALVNIKTILILNCPPETEPTEKTVFKALGIDLRELAAGNSEAHRTFSVYFGKDTKGGRACWRSS